jgi:hypothetical protein
MSTVWQRPRRVIVHTEHWPTDRGDNFRTRLQNLLDECRAAHDRGEKLHPCVFFVGSEDIYDQLDFMALIETGIEMLIGSMPSQQRRFRDSSRYVPPAVPSNAPPEVDAPVPQVPDTEVGRVADDPADDLLADVEDDCVAPDALPAPPDPQPSHNLEHHPPPADVDASATPPKAGIWRWLRRKFWDG